jgi:hypothetical protein
MQGVCDGDNMAWHGGVMKGFDFPDGPVVARQCG